MEINLPPREIRRSAPVNSHLLSTYVYRKINTHTQTHINIHEHGRASGKKERERGKNGKNPLKCICRLPTFDVRFPKLSLKFC